MSSSPRFARARRSTTTRRFGSTRMARVCRSRSPSRRIRNEKGEVVGASKIARDITERSRLLAAAREHAANTEKLGEVGAVVASTLDREAIIQKVTDIATELTHAEFGAFFYNVTDPESGDAYMLLHAVGGPAGSVCAVSRILARPPCLPRRFTAKDRSGWMTSRRIHAMARARRISGCRRDTCRSGAILRCR